MSLKLPYYFLILALTYIISRKLDRTSSKSFKILFFLNLEGIHVSSDISPFSFIQIKYQLIASILGMRLEIGIKYGYAFLYLKVDNMHFYLSHRESKASVSQVNFQLSKAMLS